MSILCQIKAQLRKLLSQGRDLRRKSMAVRNASHTGYVTNTEETRDSINRLAVFNVKDEKESSTAPSLNRLQAKVSSFNAFAGVRTSNRAEKRREVC